MQISALGCGKRFIGAALVVVFALLVGSPGALHPQPAAAVGQGWSFAAISAVIRACDGISASGSVVTVS